MTDKPKRRRAKKPLGSHPLDDKLMAERMADLDRAKKWMAENKPFYTAPRRRCAGPMLTNDDLRERELDENRREDPLGYWGTFRDEVV